MLSSANPCIRRIGTRLPTTDLSGEASAKLMPRVKRPYRNAFRNFRFFRSALFDLDDAGANSALLPLRRLALLCPLPLDAIR